MHPLCGIWKLFQIERARALDIPVEIRIDFVSYLHDLFRFKKNIILVRNRFLIQVSDILVINKVRRIAIQFILCNSRIEIIRSFPWLPHIPAFLYPICFDRQDGVLYKPRFCAPTVLQISFKLLSQILYFLYETWAAVTQRVSASCGVYSE